MSDERSGLLAYTERSRQRGAITEIEFLAELDQQGFVSVEPACDCSYEFEHPMTGMHRYRVKLWHGSYARTLVAILAERDAHMN